MFLGVDGGGTKTAVCLVTREGELVAEHHAPSIYYFSRGIELVGRVLSDAVAAVYDKAGISPEQVDYAFFGMPAYGEVRADLPALDAAPRAILRHGRYACGNDMICGWAGSLGGRDGINVVSGTGSIAYGERGGRNARVGGWGELFGDEGSAYWIAVRGLGVFSRMSDGRLPVGPLHQSVRQHLGVSEDVDVIDVVLNQWGGGDRNRVAALSRVVSAAADAGDEQAARIVRDAAGELVEMVDVTRQRLGFGPGDSVESSYSGGVFGSPRLLEAFTCKLAARHPGYNLHKPLYPPVVGAALYAAKLAGTPLSESALDRLAVTKS